MPKTRKSGRKGPTDSATLFNVGTQMEGNNGHMWEIKRNKNGIHRWKRISNTKRNHRNNLKKTKRVKVKRKRVNNTSTKSIKKQKQVPLVKQMKDNPWMKDILTKLANGETLSGYDQFLFSTMKKQPLPKGGMNALIKTFKK